MSRIIVKNLPKRITEAQLKRLFERQGQVTDVKLVKDYETNEFRGFAFIGFRDPESGEEAINYHNDTYIGTAKVSVEAARATNDPTIRPWSSKQRQKPQKETQQGDVVDHNRLFLRNLSYTITKDDIEGLFSQYGKLNEITLPIDTETQVPKGYAYVRFENTEEAVQAFHDLDGTVFLGRLLHIIQAKPKPEVQSNQGQTSYKKLLWKKLKERSGDQNVWNTLFINADTVAQVMAKKFSLTKGQFLDQETQNLAVQISLAETQILEETKRWMDTENINYEAFTGKKSDTQRSDCVILIKNLAPNTSVTTLQEYCGRYGPLGRTSINPSHTLGIVEFLNPNHASTAFNALSYKHINKVPIYLEWAPLHTFKTEVEEQQAEVKVNTNTLFIKNLNFSTTKEKLNEVFQTVGKVKSVKIIKKDGMSCGYGFVQFSSEKSARKAMRNLNNTVIDDHAIKLQESKQSVKSAPKKRQREDTLEEDLTLTKLLIKNLPFEATKKELRSIFGNYGTVKSVRIPTKYTGGHRGFAFIDFATHEDAVTALSSLNATHMYGRRLNLEWAKEETTVTGIRKKIKVQDK